MDAKWLADDVPIIDLRAYNESGEIHTIVLQLQAARAAGRGQRQPRQPAHLDLAHGAADPRRGAAGGHRAQVVPADGQLAVAHRGRQERLEGSRRRSLRRQAAPTRSTRASWARPAPAIPGRRRRHRRPRRSPTRRSARRCYPHYGDTRTRRGRADDRRHHPVPRSSRSTRRTTGAALTADQLATLRKTFPDGVCDYTKPGLGQQPSLPWMTFADGPGGKPLGAPPASAPRHVAEAGRLHEGAQGQRPHPPAAGRPCPVGDRARHRPARPQAEGQSQAGARQPHPPRGPTPKCA